MKKTRTSQGLETRLTQQLMVGRAENGKEIKTRYKKLKKKQNKLGTDQEMRMKV